MDEYQRGTAAVTRHQIWKARERARFRALSEQVRLVRLHGLRFIPMEDPRMARWMDAHAEFYNARLHAAYRGIPEPFLG